MLLVLETLTWKPHIETAMDIALQRVAGGERVIYASMRQGLPACEDRASVHRLFDLPGLRTRRAANILVNRGVEFTAPSYSGEARRRALGAAREMISACSSIEDIRALGYRDYFDLGWGVLSSVISATRNSAVALDGNRRLFERYCASGILVFDAACDLIDQLQPSQILLFNGRFATTRAALRAAQSRAIPWLIHERGANKGRFWQTDCVPHDMFAVQRKIKEAWSPELAEFGHRFFRLRRARVEQAWHSFSALQTEGLVPDAMRGSGDWVTFFTSAEDEMVAIGDSFVNEAFPTQEGAIAAAAAAVAAVPGLRLCVRIHPHVAQKSESDRRKWRELDIPGALLIGPEEKFDSYALLDRSTAVLSYGSTIGIEATYWGKPSLLLSPSYYDSLGVGDVVTSVTQMEDLLRNPAPYPQESTLPYGAFWDQLGEPYVHYQPDDLHRGRICGVYLDDYGAIGLARRCASRVKSWMGLTH